MIYFDQAASSFPKPPSVAEAMAHTVNSIGANPGRGGHVLARQASEIITNTRIKIAELFGCSDPKKVIFHQNATIGLNQAIKGLRWHKNDHVIASAYEHNSIRRPLEYIKERYGVKVTYVDCPDEETDESFVSAVEHAIDSNTRLIAMTHASNVTGRIIPIDKIIALAKRNRIYTLIDASQTAGHIPIDMKTQKIDMLVFPGHKGILGPQGTGVLLVEGEVHLYPIHHGGTGAFSSLPNQPKQWPEFLESGTLNTPGIAGLYAALIDYESRKKEIVPRETILANMLQKSLEAIEGVICYGPEYDILRMPMVAFNVENVPSQEVGVILDSHYNIAVRAGLHCSPLTHEMLHTTAQGMVRASLSIYNTEDEIREFILAIKEIVASYKEL
ncbi:aminotransferase class V-fold PLP-dependent enzyme [Virgibacillus necropolis]|uniref:cysteine desulfurase n=1 Tax=Virgibacillus necropolis TaxID=163877 RepID=A0A221M827_9BACI|nr:aminotransferase class V-fold PLP-dependent enzyme [Virgibacillus necropolis]ASN03803.1 cysteine desulfurase [Virgibacillus necropolis]